MALSQQKSQPLYSARVLRDLFINGKIDFIMKLLVRMNAVLVREQQLLDQLKRKQDHQDEQDVARTQQAARIRISNLLNHSMREVLTEISTYVEA